MDSANGGKIYNFRGKPLKNWDLEIIKEIVSGFGLARKEMAATVCELLDWVRPNGKLKTVECSRLLEKLNEEGVFLLIHRVYCEFDSHKSSYCVVAPVRRRVDMAGLLTAFVPWFTPG